jgi:hypothetical protein
MRQFRRASKLTWFTALAAVLLISLLGVATQIQQRGLRRSAEQLLDDVRSINLRQTTFEEVQPIFQRWGKRATYLGGDCNASRCDFTVRLKDFGYAHEDFFRPDTPSLHSEFELRVYEWLGGSPWIVFGEISVRDGRVWGKGFGALTGSRPESRGWYHGIGEVDSMLTVRTLGAWFPSLHPEYSFSTPAPSMQLRVTFTPYAAASDVRRLMDFNLDCLTRRELCSRAEFMPSAWAQLEADGRVPINDDCNTKTVIERLSRDTANIVVTSVIENRKVTSAVENGREIQSWPGQSFSLLILRLDERLKGATDWNLAGTRRLAFPTPFTDGTPTQMHAGSRWILSYRNSRTFDESAVEFCLLLPWSKENLALVRQGISEDDRPAKLDLPFEPTSNPE